MIHYPIVQKGECANPAATICALPDFYMQDFSIVGLRVNNCNRAEEVLTQKGVPLEKKDQRLAVSVEKAAQILKVVHLLNTNGVTCDIADVADGIYQG
jgi:hypothetical protein